MIKNFSTSFFYKKISFITGMIGLSLLTACSYAPGMGVTGVIQEYSRNEKALHNVVINKLDTRFRPNSAQEQAYKRQQEYIPAYFTTRSGVNVEFQNLNRNNIPFVEDISNEDMQNIRQLVKRPKFSDYKIATGDTISVNLWAYPEVFGGAGGHGQYTVSQSGSITLPLIGRVQVKNKTKSQLRDELHRLYAKYLKKPDVNLAIVKFNGRFYGVEGKVRNPGEFVINDRPPSLMTAFSQAGGLLDTANSHKITLNRRGRSYHFGLPQLRKMGISTSNIFLQNGDTVYVESNADRKVYLIGEVGKSTNIIIPENGLTLANALGDSQGINPTTANSAKIYVVRDEQNRNLTHIYRLDLSELENLALASQFKMLPNDMVYVDATGLTRWNRVLSQILASANAIRTGQAIGK